MSTRSPQLTLHKASRLLAHLMEMWPTIIQRRMTQDDYINRAERDLGFQITIPQLRRIIKEARKDNLRDKWPHWSAEGLVRARKAKLTTTASLAVVVDTLAALHRTLGADMPANFQQLVDRYAANRS